MEKIQFGESEQRYPIKSIQPVALHVLRIIYAEDVPEESAYSEPMTLYSNGDVKESTLTGWGTVYYSDGLTVYLSDDGSVYTEPEETEPEPDEPYEPTIEELQTYKISEMQSTCASTIKGGIDVNGEHFTLDSEARLALIAREFQIAEGVGDIDFYPDGKPSKYYTAEEMQAIIDTANSFINGHEVYCNELCLWIETLTNADEIESVCYGMDIPEEHRSSVLSDLIFHSKDELRDEEEEPDDDSDDDTDAGDKMDF